MYMWFTEGRFAGKCGSDLQSSEVIFPKLKFCQYAPSLPVSVKHLKDVSEAVCIHLPCIRPVTFSAQDLCMVQAPPAVTSMGLWGGSPQPDQGFVLQQVGFTTIWFWLSLGVQVSVRPHTSPMAGQVTYSIHKDPSFPFAAQVETWHHQFLPLNFNHFLHFSVSELSSGGFHTNLTTKLEVKLTHISLLG